MSDEAHSACCELFACSHVSIKDLVKACCSRDNPSSMQRDLLCAKSSRSRNINKDECYCSLNNLEAYLQDRLGRENRVPLLI